jgi:glycerophosphoryl diester phosphodiesterase
MSEEPTSLRRRTFVKGTGAAAVGATGTSTVARSRTDRADDAADTHTAERTDGGVSSTTTDDVTLVGHRGFAGVSPENTVEAVRTASRGPTPAEWRRMTDVIRDRIDPTTHGGEVPAFDESTAEAFRGVLDGDPSAVGVPRADVIEVDVMPCAGGELVVFHDETLSRLTDASGVVWETDCETVRSAEVLESGETIPLLSEIMDAIPPSVGVNLEFKNRGFMDWEAFADEALSIAADHDNEILVSSFDASAVAAVSENYPDVPVAFLFWNDVQAGLDVTEEYGCDAMNVPYNMVAGSPFFSEDIGFDNVPDGGYAEIDLVEKADARGIDLNVWTVRTWYQAERLIEAGVDGIISDYPNLL